MRNIHATRPLTRERVLLALQLSALDIPRLSLMLQVHRNTLERELDELASRGLVKRLGEARIQPRRRHGGRRPYVWTLAGQGLAPR
jgi:predicted ArsR family transcriptional regulator